MTNVTNLSEFIEVESHRQWEMGIHIHYILFGRDQSIAAFPVTVAADLLKEATFILDYTGAGDEVAVEYEREVPIVGIDGVLQTQKELVQEHWSEYVVNRPLSTAQALAIATMMEVKYEQSRKARDTSPEMEVMLTFEEVAAWQLLEGVEIDSTWGHSIAWVRANISPRHIRDLLYLLQEHAAYNPDCMRQMIGDEAVEFLENLYQR